MSKGGGRGGMTYVCLEIIGKRKFQLHWHYGFWSHKSSNKNNWLGAFFFLAFWLSKGFYFFFIPKVCSFSNKSATLLFTLLCFSLMSKGLSFSEVFEIFLLSGKMFPRSLFTTRGITIPSRDIFHLRITILIQIKRTF